MVTGQVLNLENLARCKARKAAFVGIIYTVGPVHCQKPSAIRPEGKAVNGVLEAVRPPPAGGSRWIAHSGIDFCRGCGNVHTSRIGALFDWFDVAAFEMHNL